MRAVAWVILVSICVPGIGCSLFNKRSRSSTPTTPPSSDHSNAGDRAAIAPPIDYNAPPSSVGGILAGQVIDRLNQRPTVSFIQVADLEGPSGGAPIEVASDSQGYFTIQGLKRGHHYRLIARAKDNGRTLAGTTFAIAPNPKLLISVSEDFAPSTPPVSNGAASDKGSSATGAPSPTENNRGATDDRAKSKPERDSQTWVPGRDPSDTGARGTVSIPSPRQPSAMGAELRAPERGTAAPVMGTPVPPASQARTNPNITSIPAQFTVPSTAPEMRRPAPTPVPAGPAPVPSCDLVGNTLHNFALPDLAGRPWEYLRRRQGRLMLLDFWETGCVPCQSAIWHLRQWQDRFAPYGLEIVGISYETGTFAEKVAKVEAVQHRLSINYQLLMGGNFNSCPVRAQFGIRAFPTLVLIDDTGRIIWRAEGFDRDTIPQLEGLFRERLGVAGR